MKLLLENWRNYSNRLNEELLLIEGRIDNAKKKFPKLSKTSDLFGTQKSRLDQLVQADPSGNQKYLLDAARILNYEIYEDPSQMLDGNRITLNLIDYIEKYHKLHSFIRDMDAPFRDLGNVNDFATLRAVVDAAKQRKEASGRKKISSEESAKRAREESRVIYKQRVVGEPGKESIHPEDKTKNYIIRRPLTEFASCRYGKGAEWCISTTESENMFDEYTDQGIAFYMITFFNLPRNHDYKTMTIGVAAGNLEIFNARNKQVSSDSIIEALIQNLLNLNKYPLAYEWTEPGQPVDYDKTKSDYKKAATDLGLDYDKVNVFKALQSMAREQKNEILDLARADQHAKPAGPPKEEFSELLESYNFRYIKVEFMMPQETGGRRPQWESYMDINLDDIVGSPPHGFGFKWKDEYKEESISSSAKAYFIIKWGNEFKALVEDALSDVLIDSELVAYGRAPRELKIIFEKGSGSLSPGFTNFLYDTKYADNKFVDGQFDAALIERLLDAGFIGRNESEEQQEPAPEEKEEQLEPLQETFRRWRKLII